MRSSNCTAFAISASGIGLLASDPRCKLTVSLTVPTRAALEFPRDFRGAERPNRLGDRKFESGFIHRRVLCEPDFLAFATAAACRTGVAIRGTRTDEPISPVGTSVFGPCHRAISAGAGST